MVTNGYQTGGPIIATSFEVKHQVFLCATNFHLATNLATKATHAGQVVGEENF